jgi:hypothetical protein
MAAAAEDSKSTPAPAPANPSKKYGTTLVPSDLASWAALSNDEWLAKHKKHWHDWRVANGGDANEAPSVLNDPNFILYRTDAKSWRFGKNPPVVKYRRVRELYLREAHHPHLPGSLEFITSNFVKNLEIEYSNLKDTDEFLTADKATFEYVVPGRKALNLDDFVAAGTYNAIIGDHPLYAHDQTWDESHVAFWGSLKTGFAWEVIECYGAVPKIGFTWTHWGHFDGVYKSRCPMGPILNKGAGQRVSVGGHSVAVLNKDLKLVRLENYSDPTPFLQELVGDSLNKK